MQHFHMIYGLYCYNIYTNYQKHKNATVMWLFGVR